MATSISIVGVVGAGTMGAGIAQVAAAAGHEVRLFDVRQGASQAAIDAIAKGLAGQVEKGRLDAGERQATLSRLAPVASLEALREAGLVVEVIVENLEAKQSLMRELEALVDETAVLATNTSSISVTAIAQGLRHPQRVVGMHFFNPVPAMKLVEVVSGAQTSREVAAKVFDLAARWGKTPVHARSTPGFIVNRLARPYYAEALALLQEQAATPADIDAMARGAGFRMGPCELMDLIGHDVNYAVTQSVFAANFGDRRYVPSLVQKDLLDGGRLGRKSGKGFYDGVPSAEAPSTERPGLPVPLPVPLRLHGRGPVADGLRRWLGAQGLAFSDDPGADWTGIALDGVQIHVSDGRSAIQLAALRRHRALAVMDLPVFNAQLHAIGLAFAASMDATSRELAVTGLRACGFAPREMRDVPGLWAARTIAMLVNEGADAVWQGVCDEAAADLAMKLGTNWPAGPFEWLAAIGVEHIVAILDHLHAATRNERYRVSPLLQQGLWATRLAG